MGFQAKYPGPKMLLRPVEMRFDYQHAFAVPSPDAYETLLWDVMNDDPTLFMRADQIEAAWQVLMPVLEAWAASTPRNFPNYAVSLPEFRGHLRYDGEHPWNERRDEPSHVNTRPRSCASSEPAARAQSWLPGNTS